MNELDTMKRAKEYIEKMANGINPITGEAVSDNDTLNNIRVARCLFYVSSILDKEINKGSKLSRDYSKQAPFKIDKNQLSSYPYDEEKISLSAVVKKINGLVMRNDFLRLKYNDVAYHLIEEGYLTERVDGLKRTKKIPTQAGIQLGIEVEKVTNSAGNQYDVILYNVSAQKYIVDNLIRWLLT